MDKKELREELRQAKKDKGVVRQLLLDAMVDLAGEVEAIAETNNLMKFNDWLSTKKVISVFKNDAGGYEGVEIQIVSEDLAEDGFLDIKLDTRFNQIKGSCCGVTQEIIFDDTHNNIKNLFRERANLYS